MNLAGIGSIMAGAGALAGALGSKKVKTGGYRYGTQIRDRVADARAAGISPLAALGFQGSAPPNFNLPGQADATGAAFQGVGRAMQGYAAAMRQESLDNQRLQNDKLRTEVDSARLQLAMAEQEVAKQRLSQMRLAASVPNAPKEMVPAFAQVYDNRTPGPLPKGQYWVTNPELGESLEGMGPLGLSVYGNAYPQGWQPPILDLFKSILSYKPPVVRAFERFQAPRTRSYRPGASRRRKY